MQFIHLRKESVTCLSLHLQPWTKAVGTNRENAYFFLSSWQKLKPSPNECPISPLPLSKVVQDSMASYSIVLYTLVFRPRQF